MGINIDDKIDDLTNKLIACRDGWLSNKRKLDKILNDLLEMRHSVRNFEVEVEDYLLRLSISTMPTIVNQLAEPVVQILNELIILLKEHLICVF